VSNTLLEKPQKRKENRIFTLIKKNWVGFLGLIIGIIGISLSIFLYSNSKKERNLYFVIETPRSNVLDFSKLTDAPLKILRRDGSQIEGNVYIVKFYFWNAGRLSIRNSEILEPLVIHFEGKETEILDYRILKTSRDLIKMKLDRAESDPLRSLDLSFKILEHYDGFCTQIIYKGTENIAITLEGSVEGIKTINTTLPARYKTAKIFTFLFYLAICVFFVFYLEDKIIRFLSELKFKIYTRTAFLVVLVALMIIAVFYLGKLSESIISADLAKMVPHNIVPS
jgi:hypothetical protein